MLELTEKGRPRNQSSLITRGWAKIRSIVRRAPLVRAWTGAQQLELSKEPRPQILLVGPGEEEVPPNGWGAVERIIAEQADWMRRKSISVDVLNSRNPIHWAIAFSRRPHVVLNHYDFFSRICRRLANLLRIPMVTLTHYAFAGFPQSWGPGYREIVHQVSRADGFIALSDRIHDVYRGESPDLLITTVPNGASVRTIRFEVQGKGCVFLGKVESRKRQFDLCASLSPDFDISFIGPIADERVDQLDRHRRAKFLGPWSRGRIEEELTQFSVLVLSSAAEADALVAYEAQAAGLSVVMSPGAVGAQNVNLPWLYVSPTPTPSEELLLRAEKENAHLREQIRAHAERHFDVDLRIQSVMQFIERVQAAHV